MYVPCPCWFDRAYVLLVLASFKPRVGRKWGVLYYEMEWNVILLRMRIIKHIKNRVGINKNIT